MNFIKKIKTRKTMDKFLEEFTQEKRKISKLLAPARNAYWIHYEPYLANDIAEIDYKSIHSSLDEAIGKVEPFQSQIKNLKDFYYSNYSAFKQEHHDAMSGLNVRLAQVYDDIHSLIINFNSLEFRNTDSCINEVITHLKKLQTCYCGLLEDCGINVPDLEITSKEKTNEL